MLVGLIGYPVKHSVSASFQQAAFDHLGIDARYEHWEVPLDGLAAKIAELRTSDHLGANVTIPHKQAVMPLLDEIDDVAGRIGAVNAIVNRQGRLAGFNTDAHGFVTALRRDGSFDPRGKQVVMLGAGGAARAAAFMLLREGASSLAIINRDMSRTRALVQDLEQAPGSKEQGTIAALPWEPDALRLALGACDLVVNCTPLGTWGGQWEGRSPLQAASISSGVLVFDLVYNPAETPLLAEARKAGARTLGGLPMLVYQGAAAFELWTGQPAPVDVMMAAARWALGIID